MKEPACVGGQEKERRAAEYLHLVGICIVQAMAVFHSFTHLASTWARSHCFWICADFLSFFNLCGPHKQNSSCCKPQRKHDMQPFIHQRQFKVFINDPQNPADRKAARSPNFQHTFAENLAYCGCSIQMCNMLATKWDTITSCKDGANIQYVSSHSAWCS